MRIIAGLYKGRNLLPPPGDSITRPITGAVKKSLFGMLGEDLTGQVVIDLFCGTGTLGIEALSRGAVKCYFAEQDPSVVQRLVRNLQDCRASERAVVWRGDILARLGEWLPAVTEPVDVAFVDPPYAMARQWWPQPADETDEPNAADEVGEAAKIAPPPAAGARPSPQSAIFEPLAARLASDGIVVLRTDDGAQIPQALGPLAVARVRKYGDMVLTLLGKESHEPPATSH